MLRISLMESSLSSPRSCIVLEACLLSLSDMVKHCVSLFCIIYRSSKRPIQWTVYEKLSIIDDYVLNFLFGGFLDIRVIAQQSSVISLHEAAFSEFTSTQRCLIIIHCFQFGSKLYPIIDMKLQQSKCTVLEQLLWSYFISTNK